VSSLDLARKFLGPTLRRARRARARWHGLVDSRRQVPAGTVPVRAGGRPLAARVVSAFDARAVAAETLDLVRGALDAADVPFVLLPRTVDGLSVLAVEDERRAAVVGALATLTGPEWAAAPGRGAAPLRAWLDRAPSDWSRTVVFRALAAPTGRLLGDAREGVAVELWPALDQPAPRVDGNHHLPGTHVAPHANTSFAYLTPTAWDAAVRGDAERPLAVPHLLEVTEPIDIVYTWVDGSDPDWLRRKDEALGRVTLAHINETATSPSRFTNRDELRYSLRSVEMYASWVRTIHLVTDRQVPDWLDTDHPRIHVVDHREIFADPDALPVFNSHAIESQLHHVPGLSDRYLYMNDDVFFGRPTSPELFFEANGLTRFFLSKMLLDVDPPGPRDLPVLSAAKNNRALVEKTFGRTVTNKFWHTPHPQNKAVLAEIEARFPELLDATMRSRFRHPEDVSIASALHHYYAYATGRAVPGDLLYAYQDISAVRSAADYDRMLREPGLDVFCLNETHIDGPAAERAGALAVELLETMFPLPSSFEKR
jgi:hypothetical protein